MRNPQYCPRCGSQGVSEKADFVFNYASVCPRCKLEFQVIDILDECYAEFLNKQPIRMEFNWWSHTVVPMTKKQIEQVDGSESIDYSPIPGPCTYCGDPNHWRPDCPRIAEDNKLKIIPK